MDIALFTNTGLQFLLRWFHYFFGVVWIGMLYYFNFVQGSFFAETDAATKSNAIQKLLPRALWWFRWGAMGTMLTGVVILAIRGHEAGFEIFTTSWGVSILTGALFGLTMWFNVWFVIWPNQKIVIQSATQAASGGAALPEAAAAGARALVASRTNTMFSIPMLFFMGAASHLPLSIRHGNYLPYAAAIGLLWAILELNALKGKTGPLTTVKGVIHAGFGLAAVIYVLMEVIL